MDIKERVEKAKKAFIDWLLHIPASLSEKDLDAMEVGYCGGYIDGIQLGRSQVVEEIKEWGQENKYERTSNQGWIYRTLDFDKLLIKLSELSNEVKK